MDDFFPFKMLVFIAHCSLTGTKRLRGFKHIRPKASSELHFISKLPYIRFSHHLGTVSHAFYTTPILKDLNNNTIIFDFKVFNLKSSKSHSSNINFATFKTRSAK